ncbi:hypothetical protein [uncultured Legionella sp.]|uniref:hypothetical protein n=1 Tax=uncultured Legionella sp. TaxID=210934 RepID=UPI00261D3BC8|nr:hypothetical protein [uncultured Legionella sp.]
MNSNIIVDWCPMSLFSLEETLAGIELHHMVQKGQQHKESANQTIKAAYYLNTFKGMI